MNKRLSSFFLCVYRMQLMLTRRYGAVIMWKPAADAQKLLTNQQQKQHSHPKKNCVSEKKVQENLINIFPTFYSNIIVMTEILFYHEMKDLKK